MKINSDVITVDAGWRDEKGQKLEPEEQRSARTITVTDVDLSMKMSDGSPGNNAMTADQELAHPTKLTYEMPAIDLAQAVSSICASCKFWDRRGWTALRKSWEHKSGGDGRLKLLEFAGHIKMTIPGIDDHATVNMINNAGICTQLTDAFREPVVTHGNCGCPSDPGPNGEDLSQLYRPADRGKRVSSSKSYDAILKLARGK